jgi:hypothetical protein
LNKSKGKAILFGCLAVIFVSAVVLICHVFLGEKDEQKAKKGIVRKTNESIVAEEITDTPTMKPTENTQPSEEPTPTAEPTFSPTPSPTPEPTPTPTPDSGDNIVYGDLTQYLGMTAGEIIDIIGKDYAYGCWEKELHYGTTGGFGFEYGVFFYFEDERDSFDLSRVVTIIQVSKSEDQENQTVSQNIGNGLNSVMNGAELKNVMGNAFDGPSGPSLLDDTYVASGVYKGCRYYFQWYDDPMNEGADEIYISKTGLSFIH